METDRRGDSSQGIVQVAYMMSEHDIYVLGYTIYVVGFFKEGKFLQINLESFIL